MFCFKLRFNLFCLQTLYNFCFIQTIRWFKKKKIFARKDITPRIRSIEQTRAIELSIRERILTMLTLRRRTNATHLVTVNVNDLAIIRADNRRDPEKGNYRGIEKERREGEARRQVVS